MDVLHGSGLLIQGEIRNRCATQIRGRIRYRTVALAPDIGPMTPTLVEGKTRELENDEADAAFGLRLDGGRQVHPGGRWRNVRRRS